MEEEVARLADEIVIIDKGQVIAIGSEERISESRHG